MLAQISWTIGLILLDWNKILLIKRQNTGYFDGYWGFPAWRLDNLEHFKDWMIREAQEEIWIDLKQNELNEPIIIHRLFEDHQVISMYFVCQKWDHKPKNNEPEKCEKIEWFELNNLPQNCMPSIITALSCLWKQWKYFEINEQN